MKRIRKKSYTTHQTPEIANMIERAIQLRGGNVSESEIIRMSIRALNAFDRNGIVTADDLLDPKVRRR